MQKSSFCQIIALSLKITRYVKVRYLWLGVCQEISPVIAPIAAPMRIEVIEIASKKGNGGGASGITSTFHDFAADACVSFVVSSRHEHVIVFLLHF